MDVLKPVMYIKEKNSRAGKGLTTQLCYISQCRSKVRFIAGGGWGQ